MEPKQYDFVLSLTEVINLINKQYETRVSRAVTKTYSRVTKRNAIPMVGPALFNQLSNPYNLYSLKHYVYVALDAYISEKEYTSKLTRYSMDTSKLTEKGKLATLKLTFTDNVY